MVLVVFINGHLLSLARLAPRFIVHELHQALVTAGRLGMLPGVSYATLGFLDLGGFEIPDGLAALFALFVIYLEHQITSE
ncbi:hypothetical protein D3C71_1535610 [compost metagenome]